MTLANPKAQTSRDLVAWQKAYALGLTVDGVAAKLPDGEQPGLASRLRRGAVAIASNIAEGYGRGGRQDSVRFFKIARGALYELDAQLCFCRDLSYLAPDQFDGVKAQLDEAERILAGLIRSLEAPA